jgi:hypothetical protein
MASEGVQEGVKAFIDSLDQKPPKPPATVETNVWLVHGLPGKSVPPGAALNEVAPALAQIEKSDGPMEFKLLEKLSMTQLSGESAKVHGRQFQVNQTTWMKPEGLTSDLVINTIESPVLETRVSLRPEQVIVLGSTGDGSNEAPRSVYVLIRAGLHDGAGQ